MFNDNSLEVNDWTPRKVLEVGTRINNKGLLSGVQLTQKQAEALLAELNAPSPEARCREALTDVLRPIYDHRHQKTGDTVRDLQILIAGLHAAIQKHTAVIDSLDLSSTPQLGTEGEQK